MSTLHLIRQSAFNTSDLSQCLSVLSDKDALVLIDDGCYNLNHLLLKPLLQQVAHPTIQTGNSLSVNVVASHVKARAIQFPDGVTLLEMSDVVDLTFAHNKVITWQ